jgi:endonuclease G, mitochondrial
MSPQASALGYDDLFLGPSVAAPAPAAGDVALPYFHFTVVFAPEHRLARYTVVNIDGTHPADIGPREDDQWDYDDRVRPEDQVGDSFYHGNPWGFDRGHLVRRLDPVWGDKDDGVRAAVDTFHFTNCAPQHSAFNRGKQIWQGLERYILENGAEAHRLRATVFSGPIFDPGNPIRGDLPIPVEFWKVVVIVRQDGGLHATAYVLSQADRVPALVEGEEEFVFGQYRTYQRAVSEVAERTALDFSQLIPADPYPGRRPSIVEEPERELTDLSEIIL